ncbi:MAG: alpha/beta hydrolase family protein [Fimbriimonadales bacterium]|nr:alpha/beta hydrolase family protein [Fimbriimonadales bacterium]
MRSVLAAGWLVLAMLAFWLAYWAGDEAATLSRAGMALYALLLTLSLVVAVRGWLNASRRGASCLWLLALGTALCHAQDLRAPLDPVFPSRLLSSIRRDGYIEYRVEFPSAFASRFPANNTVRAWWLVPAERVGRAPTVVLLHSLGIRRPELEMGLARELVRHGIAVLLMTLPYHMQRTPPGYGSGDLILAGDVALLREATVQATWDVRRAFDWLQRQPEIDPERIALVGVSLGAILGSTVLAVEPRVHTAVLILGGADLAHVLWESVLAIRARARLRRDGYTLERLRAELAPVEPLNLLTPEHGAKTFVIGARFDIVVPTEDTEKLIRALGNPKVFWLNTGHFGGGLVQRPLFRMVRQYLQARFEGQANPSNAPRLFAPTVRIGAIYSAGRDFRLALGTDFWRSDKNGTLFVVGVLTPRGGSLFAGVRLRLGFSAGAEITPKRTYGAVFWHFVL